MKIEFIDKALYLPEEKILVIADLHLGYESLLINSGIFIPRIEKKETIRNLKEIFEKIEKEKRKISEIVILGDIKHLFGGFSLEDWKEVKDVLDFISKYGKIILIRGNHDKYLKALEKNYEVKDFYISKDICFFHGHKIFKECFGKNVKMLVFGHAHPVVYLSEGSKKESFKCFLKGKYKGKEVYVLPAFSSSYQSNGYDISSGKLFEINIKNFEVYVVGDKEVLKSQKSEISDDHQNSESIILRFGKVKDIGVSVKKRFFDIPIFKCK